MLNVTKNISSFIKEQFPDIYRYDPSRKKPEKPEEAQFLIDFTKTYYDFVDATMDRDIPKLRDIDTTLANFLIFFKKKYLLNLPLTDANSDVADTRFIIKHIQDLYTRKGSEESLRLLFKLFYNTEIELYYPSIAIFKASDSVWEDKIYLEFFTINTMLDYPVSKGDKLTGSITGASGYVDEIIFINYSGTLAPVAYLSNVSGKFSNDDSIMVTRTSNTGITTSTSAGKLIRGSITALSILPGARDGQKLGEVLKVRSAKAGTGGTALVRELAEGNTSTIGFELDAGGFGYITPVSGNTVTLSNQVVILQQSLSPTIKVGDSLYSHGSVVSAISADGASIGTPANISGGGRVIEYQHPLVYINTTDQTQIQFLTYVYDQLVAATSSGVDAEMKAIFNTEVDGRRLGVLRDSITNGGYDSGTGLYSTAADAAKFLLYREDVVANTNTAGAAAKALIEDKLLPAVFATGIGYKFLILPDNGQANIKVSGDVTTEMNMVQIGDFNESASYEISSLDDASIEEVVFITDLVGDFINTKLQETVIATAMLQNKTYIIDDLGSTTQDHWHDAAGTSNTGPDYVVGDIFTSTAAAESVDGDGKVVDVDDTNYGMSGTSPLSGRETLYTKFKDAFTPLQVTIGTIDAIRVTQDVDSVYKNAVFSEVEYDPVSKFNKTNAVLTIDPSPNIQVGDIVTQIRTIDNPKALKDSDAPALITDYEVKGRCVGDEEGTNNFKFVQLSFYDFVPTSGVGNELIIEKNNSKHTITKVSRDANSLPMGRNAIVSTTASLLSDQITKVTPVKSGFQYDNGEEVDLLRSVTAGNFVAGLEYIITGLGEDQESAQAFANIVDPELVTVPESGILPVGTVFTATGAGTGTGTADTLVARAKLTTLGQGQKGGSWQDATSFVSNNTKVLHDNYYYQEYSYDIASIINSDKYTTLVDDIVGVAGTKMFSSPLINTSNDILSLKMDAELKVWNINSAAYITSTSAATYTTDATPEIVTISNVALADPRTVNIANNVGIVDTDFSVICAPDPDIKVGDVIRISGELGTGDDQATITGLPTEDSPVFGFYLLLGQFYTVSSIDVTADFGLTAPDVTGFTLVNALDGSAVVTTPGKLEGLTFSKVAFSLTCSETEMRIGDKVTMHSSSDDSTQEYYVSSIDDYEFRRQNRGPADIPSFLSDDRGLTYTGVTAFTLVRGDGDGKILQSAPIYFAILSAGLTFTRFTETDGVKIYTTDAPLVNMGDISFTLNIDDTDFSVTSSVGKNIAVGDRIQISGDNTGTGSITGYTSDKKYMVSSIDAGTASNVTGFTLFDPPLITSFDTLAGASSWWDPIGTVVKDGKQWFTNPNPDQGPAAGSNGATGSGARAGVFTDTGLTDVSVSSTRHSAPRGHSGPVVCINPDDTKFGLALFLEDFYGTGALSYVLWELGRQPDDLDPILFAFAPNRVEGHDVVLRMDVEGGILKCYADDVLITWIGGSTTYDISALAPGLLNSTLHGMSVDVNGDGPQTDAMKLGTVPFERQGNIPCAIYPTLILPYGGTVVTTPGTLAGLTYTRFAGTKTDDELHATIIELETEYNAQAGGEISFTLNIDDSNFSVTSSVGKNIAVGDRIQISGFNTGTGSITGYNNNSGKYMVSSIDAGTAPNVTGFTLVSATADEGSVVTTSGTLAGLTYTRINAQPTVPFFTP